MLVLLKFCQFCLLFFNFSVGPFRMQVLFEGRSLSRIYGRYVRQLKYMPRLSRSSQVWEKSSFLPNLQLLMFRVWIRIFVFLLFYPRSRSKLLKKVDYRKNKIYIEVL